jgi:hypothetical protein
MRVKFSLCLIKHHAMKMYGGVEVYIILELGTKLRWVMSFTPQAALVPEKEPPVPTGQETGWAPEPIPKNKHFEI